MDQEPNRPELSKEQQRSLKNAEEKMQELLPLFVNPSLSRLSEAYSEQEGPEIEILLKLLGAAQLEISEQKIEIDRLQNLLNAEDFQKWQAEKKRAEEERTVATQREHVAKKNFPQKWQGIKRISQDLFKKLENISKKSGDYNYILQFPYILVLKKSEINEDYISKSNSLEWCLLTFDSDQKAALKGEKEEYIGNYISQSSYINQNYYSRQLARIRVTASQKPDRGGQNEPGFTTVFNRTNTGQETCYFEIKDDFPRLKTNSSVKVDFPDKFLCEQMLTILKYVTKEQILIDLLLKNSEA